MYTSSCYFKLCKPCSTEGLTGRLPPPRLQRRCRTGGPPPVPGRASTALPLENISSIMSKSSTSGTKPEPMPWICKEGRALVHSFPACIQCHVEVPTWKALSREAKRRFLVHQLRECDVEQTTYVHACLTAQRNPPNSVLSQSHSAQHLMDPVLLAYACRSSAHLVIARLATRENGLFVGSTATSCPSNYSPAGTSLSP